MDATDAPPDVLAELRAIRAELAAVKSLLTRRDAGPAKPPRGKLRAKAAAARLGCGARRLRQWIAEGVLSDARAVEDRRPRKALLLWADEVEALAEHGEAAARELRRLRRRAT